MLYVNNQKIIINHSNFILEEINIVGFDILASLKIYLFPPVSVFFFLFTTKLLMCAI